MKSRPALWICSATTALLTSCALFTSGKSDPAKDQPASAPPKLIGRIASIPANKRFVLIQSYGAWNVETGTILTTRGPDDRTANLLTTGESLGQFAAADLQSGLVKVGDAVYSRHLPKPPPTPTTTPTDPPQPTPKTTLKNN